MQAVHQAIRAFNAGEWSPLLWRRADLAKYPQAARRLENFIALREGPATRRPGTRHVAATRDHGDAVLIPWQFAIDDALVIEAGDGYFRFFAGIGRVESAPGVPLEIGHPYGAAECRALRWVQSADVLYLVHRDHPVRRLNRLAATTWTLTAAAIADGPYLPVNDDETLELSVQGGSEPASGSARVRMSATTNQTGAGHSLHLRVDVPGGRTVRARIGSQRGTGGFRDSDFGAGTHAAGFTPTASPFWIDVEYQGPGAAEVEVLRITVSNGSTNRGDWSNASDDGWAVALQGLVAKLFAELTGPQTVTASAAVFDADDVDRAIRLRTSDRWGWGTVTAVTDGQQATIDFKTPVDSRGPTAIWRWGAWSRRTGYPRTVGLGQGRLWFGGSRGQPNAVWGSRAGDYTSFAPTDADGQVDADHAISAELDDAEVNDVQWIAMVNGDLLIGTAGGPFVMTPDEGEVITASPAPIVSLANRMPAAPAPPLRAGESLLYVGHGGPELFELRWNWESDGYRSEDLALLASHLTRAGLDRAVWHERPWSCLWVVTRDGALLGATYLREQQVIAWHRHDLGGTVRGLAVVPAGAADRLWLIVDRQVGGETRRSVEYLTDQYRADGPTDTAGSVFLDGSLAYVGAPAATVAGLDHLEGATVQVLADGAAHDDRTVAGGEIALSRPASRVQVGLHHPAVLQPMWFESTAPDATAGRKRRLVEILVDLFETLGGRCAFDDGQAGGETIAIPFRRAQDPMDAAPPLFTGARSLRRSGRMEDRVGVTVRQDQPLPMTVTAMVPQLGVDV